MKKISFAIAVCFALPTSVALAQSSLLSSGGGGARYATDAYPGFDSEDDNVKPERKESHWWWFLVGGPDCETPEAQYAYCQQLVADGSYAKAARQLDNLVRMWPTSAEAPKAQGQLAQLLLEKLDDSEEAFKEYRYLLDFYSLRCDYSAVADKLHQVAGIRKAEGKEVMFVRFANTVDVRRCYEMCVLRAPGAKWVPEAMLTIARLREDEGKYAEAVKVFENLRNLHPDTPQAKEAIVREAVDRMVLLRDFGYNRARCRDTIGFLKLALESSRPGDAATIQPLLDEALALVDDEDYRAAKFYDAPTRTKRSAIAAYEKFIAEHPKSVHVDAARARLEKLKGEVK